MTTEQFSSEELQSRLENAISSYSPEATAAALDAGANPTKRIFNDQIAPVIFVRGSLTDEQKMLDSREPEAVTRHTKLITKLEAIISVLDEHLMMYLSNAITEHNIIRVGEALAAGANPTGLTNGQTTPLDDARVLLSKILKTPIPEGLGLARKRENEIHDLKEITKLLEMRADLPVGADKLRVLDKCTEGARKLCNGDRSKPENPSSKPSQRPMTG